MSKRLNLKNLTSKCAKGQKLTALTAYDASMAALIDSLVDIILVGDSLGTVVQGHPTTLPVKVADMLYHTRAVCRGSQRAFIVADVPFLAACTEERALRTAGRLLADGGAQMVKFECSHQQVDLVHRLTNEGIPVCAHIGYRPQSVHKSSHYFADMRAANSSSDAETQQWLSQAIDLADAGADMLLVECIPAPVAALISRDTQVPVIGIGSGDECDGQILVLYDLFGISYGGRPRFVSKLDLPPANLSDIVNSWVRGVHQGNKKAGKDSNQ